MDVSGCLTFCFDLMRALPCMGVVVRFGWLGPMRCLHGSVGVGDGGTVSGWCTVRQGVDGIRCERVGSGRGVEDRVVHGGWEQVTRYEGTS